MTDDKVTPIRPPERLPDAANRLLGAIEFAGEIEPVLDRPYLVKGWLDRGAVSVVYGTANVGKSFWAIDLAHHVHQGELWNGCKVRGGPVLYVAAEGGAMLSNRLCARKAKFCVLRQPVRLKRQNGDARNLAMAAGKLSEVHGPFSLIIFDTLARVMDGADENAAQDIEGLMGQADILRKNTGAHVMFVHHSGKDLTRGARGHSSLRAAVDTEIELTKGDDGVRMARATKQRDFAAGAEQEFDLQEVVLGRDQDGDEVTSCIIKTIGGRERQAHSEI